MSILPLFNPVRSLKRTMSVKPFRIQYISDIHLEMYDKQAFPLILKPNARYLALCGDIGYPREPIFKSFIDYCSRNWDKVFYLPGNHEYYNDKPHYHWKYTTPDTMESIENDIQTVLTPYRNVFYLNKGVHEFPEEEVNVVGATMWTHIPEDKYQSAEWGLNDFSQIACKIHAAPNYERFSPAKMSAIHKDHSAFILGALDAASEQGRSAVVLTHHMPSLSLVAHRFVRDPNNYLFYTEMTEHLKHPALAAWICGHSHSAQHVLFRPGVWLALNCRGYPNEKVGGFSEWACLELGDSATKRQASEYKEEEVELM